MLKLIPNWQDKELKCYFCHTIISVKYEMELHSITDSFVPKTVYACNKCAAMFSNYCVTDKGECKK